MNFKSKIVNQIAKFSTLINRKLIIFIIFLTGLFLLQTIDIPKEVLDQAIESIGNNIFNISLGAAFLAGLLMFFSPCTLPMIIVLLGVGSTNDVTQKPNFKKKIWLFIAGFFITLILIGFSVSYLGQLFINYRKLIVFISGIFMVVFGSMLILKLKFPDLLSKFKIKLSQSSLLSSYFFLGFFFGSGVNPCLGPILFSIFFLAANSPNIIYTLFLLGMYTLGVFSPYLFILTLAEKKEFTARTKEQFKKYGDKLTILSSFIFIILGLLYIFTGSSSLLQRDVLGLWTLIYYFQSFILSSYLITSSLTVLLIILVIYFITKKFTKG